MVCGHGGPQEWEEWTRRARGWGQRVWTCVPEIVEKESRGGHRSDVRAGVSAQGAVQQQERQGSEAWACAGAEPLEVNKDGLEGGRDTLSLA